MKPRIVPGFFILYNQSIRQEAISINQYGYMAPKALNCSDIEKI